MRWKADKKSEALKGQKTEQEAKMRQEAKPGWDTRRWLEADVILEVTQGWSPNHGRMLKVCLETRNM